VLSPNPIFSWHCDFREFFTSLNHGSTSLKPRENAPTYWMFTEARLPLLQAFLN
jgi:hypothetical protein